MPPGGRGWWTLAGSGFAPSPRGHLEGEAASALPSGIYLNIKGLSLELLWALDISTDMTFGFQWQFYGSLYSRDHSGGVQMAPLPVRRGQVVCWSEEDRKPHTLGPLLALPVTCWMPGRSHVRLRGPPFLLCAD